MQRSARRVLSLCGFQRKFPSATRKVNRRDPVVRFYADHIWLAPCQNEENVFFLALSARLWVRLHSFRRHASDKRLPPSLFCLYTEVVNWFGRNDDKKKVSILILRPLAYFVHSTIKHFLLSYSFSYVDVSPSLVYLGNYAWAFLRHFKRARVKVEDMIFFSFLVTNDRRKWKYRRIPRDKEIISVDVSWKARKLNRWIMTVLRCVYEYKFFCFDNFANFPEIVKYDNKR